MRGKDHDKDLKGVIPRVADWLFDRKKEDPSLNLQVDLSYIQVHRPSPEVPWPRPCGPLGW